MHYKIVYCNNREFANFRMDEAELTIRLIMDHKEACQVLGRGKHKYHFFRTFQNRKRDRKLATYESRRYYTDPEFTSLPS